ncbi:ABC transporter substrate-binding protein [Cohnella panacarvi]|uniref:ABC transporter substrate-binding protein n=1 Tax=Cohnella panacarvi TaxID=400776 RepID=UPI00047B2438|nr:extracellular solute-binding protein [Cohnella panacarvi]
MAQSFKFGTYLGVGLTAAMLLVSGCSKGNSANGDETRTTLKVMYYDERAFFQSYGMIYSALHTNVDFEVVSNQTAYQDPNGDYKTSMQKLIEEQKPDILMLDNSLFREYSEEGKLLDLESIAQDKSFKPDTLVPGLMEYLRDLGGGKLYGMSPNMYSQVVYYNKDLFKKHGVDLPKDGMSWDELFALAKRFPTDGDKDSRTYGLSLGWNGADAYQLGSMIASTQNLSMINPVDMKVTLNTPAWKKSFETAFEVVKSNVLHSQNMNGGMDAVFNYDDYLLQDPFVSGKVAMKMEAQYLMDQIEQAQKSPAVKDKAVKDWGIVTMPVDPANPDRSPYVNLNSLFAINAKSENADAAKEFLTYVMGEDFARVSSKAQTGGLPVRTTAYEDKEGRNVKAFYMLKPMESPMNNLYAKLPMNFYGILDGTVRGAVQSAYDGNKSLDDALKEAETQLQAELIKAQEEQKNKKAEDGAAASPAASVSAEAVAQ